MVRKTARKTVRKAAATRKTSKKTTRKTAKKSKTSTTRKTNKSAKKTVKKTARKSKPKSHSQRSVHCITVCKEDRCVQACQTTNGAVTGECIPCPLCGHGHFCENDRVCLSCGATRGCPVTPYKGE